MKKRILGVMLSMSLVSSLSIMSTVAYLTDRDSVANTFTVGDIDILLDETDVDENGKPVLDNEGTPVERVKENKYHLVPGQTYIKDPTVTVQSGSEEAYIRMIMTVTNASVVQEIIDNYELGDFSALIDGWDRDKWQYEGHSFDAQKDTIEFEFRYYKSISAKTQPEILEPLFQELIMPAEINGEELKKLNDPNGDGQYDDGFKMILQGHAIQAATFENADAAWKAFGNQANP